MSRPLFWLGIPTTKTAVVIVHSTTNGTVTVACNGSDFTATANTSVKGGIVKITVTGLSADSSYDYTVTTPNGDSGSATLKTYPESGDVKIAYYSCNNSLYDASFPVILNTDPHAVICIGDLGYYAAGPSWGSYTSSSLTGGSTTVADYHNANLVRRAPSYIRKMAENIPFAHMPDDHEWDIDNCDWSDVSAKLTTIDAMAEGTQDVLQGNPVNSDITGDTEPFYFRFECGDVEVFVLAAVIHGRDPTDGQHMVRDQNLVTGACIGRDALGADIRNQENWLLAQLAASTKKYKLILSPKMTLISTTSNADAWWTYNTEMDRVLQAIHDNSAGWSVPGGVIWGCGDWHSPGIHASFASDAVELYDHVAVTSSPMYNQIEDSGAVRANITRYSLNQTAAPQTAFTAGLWGLVTNNETFIKADIRNVADKILASAKVNAGELALAADTTDAVSI